MSEIFYNVGSLLPNNVACFGRNTYEILKSQGIIDRPHALTTDERGFATVYRCDWAPYGCVEFTADHPFQYKNKMVTFEELIQLHPKISNVEVVSLDDPDLQMVYNIIAHPDQQDEKNMFRMEEDLMMVGGRYTVDVDPVYFTKKMDILDRLFKNTDYQEIIKEKYGPKETSRRTK
jgi:hypothetical protein